MSANQSPVVQDEGFAAMLEAATHSPGSPRKDLKSLLDEGVANIVQGVGYPNPNRSHFTSMDIWHTANESGHGYGWIGRYFDNTCNGTPEPESGIAVGRAAPLAMQGAINTPITFETPGTVSSRRRFSRSPASSLFTVTSSKKLSTGRRSVESAAMAPLKSSDCRAGAAASAASSSAEARASSSSSRS